MPIPDDVARLVCESLAVKHLDQAQFELRKVVRCPGNSERYLACKECNWIKRCVRSPEWRAATAVEHRKTCCKHEGWADKVAHFMLIRWHIA